MIPALLYLAAVAAANIITARTVPADIGPFLVTWGTWLVGVTFILRDLVQTELGRRGAYGVILAGLALAGITSALLGDTLAVVAASALAFALSEAADTEVFTRLRAGVPTRVAVSGLIGAPLDSVVFCVVGLSPLWSGIVPWSALPNVIFGQIVVKCALQFAGAGVWRLVRGPEPLAGGAR